MSGSSISFGCHCSAGTGYVYCFSQKPMVNRQLFRSSYSLHDEKRLLSIPPKHLFYWLTEKNSRGYYFCIFYHIILLRNTFYFSGKIQCQAWLFHSFAIWVVPHICQPSHKKAEVNQWSTNSDDILTTSYSVASSYDGTKAANTQILTSRLEFLIS